MKRSGRVMSCRVKVHFKSQTQWSHSLSVCLSVCTHSVSVSYDLINDGTHEQLKVDLTVRTASSSSSSSSQMACAYH